MIKQFAAAILAVLLLAVNQPVRSDAVDIPAERIYPSSVGEVIFKHQKHIKDHAVECVECHHQIHAKNLKTPHPDYFKSTAANCAICHTETENIKKKTYTCSECHRTKPVNIADETLSVKVVIHKQCWNCHAVDTGKKASKGCKKCHSGKKTF